MKTALFLDDGAAAHKLFPAALEATKQWQVVPFEDAQAAIERAKFDKFDLYLIDLTLNTHRNQVDGLTHGMDVYNKLLEFKRKIGGPIVFLTGSLPKSEGPWRFENDYYLLSKTDCVRSAPFLEHVNSIMSHFKARKPKSN